MTLTGCYWSAHRVAFRGLALPEADQLATPLGTLPVDTTLYRAAWTCPGVQASDRAHAQEHSLEVHLPFLQQLFGDIPVLPVLTGSIAADDACGASAINGMVLAAAADQLQPRLVLLRNSGHTSGDRHRVVGYPAIAFTPALLP